MKRQIITTKDGSHTVEIPEMQVTYHSHHGAVQESVHVFIEAGLRFVSGHTGPTGQATGQTPAIESSLASGPTGQATRQTPTIESDLASGPTSNPPSTLRIFEMGFGTGLNTYLTALEAQRLQIPIHYTAVEQYPLKPEEAAALNYAQTEDDRQLFNQLHQAPWQEDASISPLFTLNKQQTSLLQFQLQTPVHLIYFDAFAPTAQPELWTEDVFKKLLAMLVPGGVLVTYCSKGVVRRAMQAAGFIVTKIPGPPGKREMVRAISPQTRS